MLVAANERRTVVCRFGSGPEDPLPKPPPFDPNKAPIPGDMPPAPVNSLLPSLTAELPRATSF